MINTIKPLLPFQTNKKKFHSTLQTAEDRQKKFHFCHLPFVLNVTLNLSSDLLVMMDVHNMDWQKIDCVTFKILRPVSKITQKNCFVLLKNFTCSHRKIDKFSLWMLLMNTLWKVHEFELNFTVKSNSPNLLEDLHRSEYYSVPSIF